MEQKRLFFGFEISAPWPSFLPKGRILEEENRHLTLAFLGRIDFDVLRALLPQIPLPDFKVGFTGHFDKTLFLPKAHPKVVAWNVAWHDGAAAIVNYNHVLISWLKDHGFHPDEREEFLHHVTLSRAPFDFHAWRQAFGKLPVMLKNFHLYESIGQLNYKPIWSHHLHAPFEELEHTADIAFKIRGETVPQLFLHAVSALAFKSPELLNYQKEEEQEVTTVDEIVIRLNRMVSRFDTDFGCPFKAVSFHGEIEKEPDNTLSWEMIVDV